MNHKKNIKNYNKKLQQIGNKKVTDWRSVKNNNITSYPGRNDAEMGPANLLPVADLEGGMGGCIPPHQPKSNDFGRKISLYFE